jgi:hypothetical protein
MQPGRAMQHDRNRKIDLHRRRTAGVKAVASVGNQPYNYSCCAATGISHGLGASKSKRRLVRRRFRGDIDA